jgi:hypothetical protein
LRINFLEGQSAKKKQVYDLSVLCLAENKFLTIDCIFLETVGKRTEKTKYLLKVLDRVSTKALFSGFRFYGHSLELRTLPPDLILKFY